MKSKKIFIVGAGEFAEIAYEYFTHDSEYEVVGFCVNRAYINEKVKFGLPVVPYEEIEKQFPAEKYMAFVGIPASDLNRLRTKFYNDLKIWVMNSQHILVVVHLYGEMQRLARIPLFLRIIQFNLL